MDRAQRIANALRDTTQAASNAIAGNVSGPVDLIAAALRAGGLPIPENPVGGSQWMAERGFTREVPIGVPRVIGETIGMAGPALVAANAPRIAAGINRGLDNLSRPLQLNAGQMGGQRGVVIAGSSPQADDLLAAKQQLEAAKSQPFTDSSGRTWAVDLSNPGVYRSPESSRLVETLNGYGRPQRADVLASQMGGTSDDALGLLGHSGQVRQARQARENARAIYDFVNPAQSAQKPEWVRSITQPQNTNPADADWWQSAIAERTRRAQAERASSAVNAFVDTARQSPNAMLYGPGSSSSAADDVARAFSSPSQQITAEWRNGALRFNSPEGYLEIMDADSAAPVIRSVGAGSQGKIDGSGKRLYQAAYQWLANNGKVAHPDVSLSEINQLRKVGNELSAQVRNQRPSAIMNSRSISGIQDIPNLWASEARQAATRVAPVKNLTFDGSQFLLGGRPVGDNEIVSAIASVDPSFSKGVGAMTAKRSAIYRWLQKATPEQAATAARVITAGGLAGVSPALFAAEDNNQ